MLGLCEWSRIQYKYPVIYSVFAHVHEPHLSSFVRYVNACDREVTAIVNMDSNPI